MEGLLKDFGHNGKGKMLDSSPEFRPAENSEIPPPISLSPGLLENSKIMKEMITEREQDKYLIDVLKKLSFEQAKEIEKLKSKIDHLQRDYENLLGNKKKDEVHHSIIDIISNSSRRESMNE